jgi:hypothetical protein
MALPLFSLPGRRRIVAPGGSGPDWLTLPYLYTFDGETVGQVPEGWAQSDYEFSWNFNLPTVVSNYSAGWNPERKAAHFNTTSTLYSHGEFTLPKPVNADDGFRISLWLTYEVQAIADSSIYFSGPWTGYPGAFRGIKITPRTVNPADLTRSGSYGTGWVNHSTAAGFAVAPQYWARYDVQWTPGLPNITTKVTRVSDAHLLHNAGVNPTWGADVAAAFHTFSHLTLIFPSHMNQYYRDAWLLGFWIGSLTDDWPALQMPLSL